MIDEETRASKHSIEYATSVPTETTEALTIRMIMATSIAFSKVTERNAWPDAKYLSTEFRENVRRVAVNSFFPQTTFLVKNRRLVE